MYLASVEPWKSSAGTTRKNAFVACWLSPFVSVVRVADGDTCTRPACVSAVLVETTEPDVEPPTTATMFLSEMNFCATACASAWPFSTGRSPGTSLTFSPIVAGSVLTAYFAQESCSCPRKPAAPVRGASIPMSSVFEQLMPAVAFVLFAAAGAAETVAASAVAAATAANSGNDLVFLM